LPRRPGVESLEEEALLLGLAPGGGRDQLVVA
jgi:hypothetical protein